MGDSLMLIPDIRWAVPHPVGTPTHTRRKDRLSYSHEEFSIDLTQVTSTTAPNAPVSCLVVVFKYMLFAVHTLPPFPL